ncbi:hypothetical protein [Cellulomonas soli]
MQKAALDALRLREIDLAGRVSVINSGRGTAVTKPGDMPEGGHPSKRVTTFWSTQPASLPVTGVEVAGIE